MRRLVFILLLGLAACNRHGVADVTLDADAAQRNATAAKTLNDIAAAEAASRGAAPVVHDAEPAPAQPARHPLAASPPVPAPDPAPVAAEAETGDAQTNQ